MSVFFNKYDEGYRAGLAEVAENHRALLAAGEDLASSMEDIGHGGKCHESACPVCDAIKNWRKETK